MIEGRAIGGGGGGGGGGIRRRHVVNEYKQLAHLVSDSSAPL